VIAELADGDRLTDDAIADAARHFPITTIRRLGRLLDSLDLAPLTGGLEQLASEHRRAPITALDARSPPDGPLDHRWRVAVPLRSTRTCDPHQVLQPPIAPRTPSWKFGSPAHDRLNRKGNKQFHVGS
jgi:hypothetical protein